MFLKLAWRNIWRNKRRTWITVVSILFSVFFAVIMRTMQLGMYDQMIDNVVRFYSGYLQIHQKGYWDEQTLNNTFAQSDSLHNLVKETQGVEGVVPRLEGFALSSNKDLTKGAMIVGIQPQAEKKLMNIEEKLVEGKLFKPDDKSILVAKGLAGYYDIGPGDTLVFLGQGYHGMSAAGKYPIEGILDMNSPELNDRAVFLPLKEAQWFFGTGKRLSSLALIIPKNSDVVTVAGRIRDKVDMEQLEVMTWREMMPELVQTIQADSAGGVIMVFILYMVIAFGIFGTILMMTAERHYEFGILISVGMRRWKLAATLLIETLLLALLGVTLGMAFSLPMVYYFHYNPLHLTGQAAKAMEEFGFEAILPTSTDPMILLTHTTIVLVITLILGLYPAAKVLGIKPVEAMRDQ